MFDYIQCRQGGEKKSWKQCIHRWNLRCLQDIVPSLSYAWLKTK